MYPSGPTPPSPTPEPPPVNPRERLYLAKIGKKYIAIEDVEPVLEEWDLQLWKGMRVDGKTELISFLHPLCFSNLSVGGMLWLVGGAWLPATQMNI